MSCPLWTDRGYYADMMSPDEEAEWAEHDRRCGHAPASKVGTLVFGPSLSVPARVRVSPSAAGLLLVPSPASGPAADPSKEVA